MKNPLLTAIIGLLTGVILTSLFLRQSAPTNLPTPSPSAVNHSGVTMTDMVDSLAGKTGNDFDKAFISNMIDHHIGAIEMANQATKSASHQEIQQLAKDIISAQTKEIDQMKQWYQQWGY